MKKFVSALLACVLCFLLTGCPAKISEEDKFYNAVEIWSKQTLNYETFALFDVEKAYFTWNGATKFWDDYTFVILSSDNLFRDSLRMDFDSGEEFVFRTISLEDNITKKDEWLHACVAYEWGKSIDSVACTLKYKTTNGQEVSKDYVLDFTQTPFRDFRNK